jgi:Type ISP C-terminal specificity domain/N-6 DNA Methylase
MTVSESLISFAASVRADRNANPQIAGDGTALELLLAPRFRSLLEEVLAETSAAPVSVLPEYERRGVGRPDLAFAQPASPARAFIELKEPRKLLDPENFRGHDADQFARFCELPLWALCNFTGIRLYRREVRDEQAEIVPSAALDPATSAAAATRLINAQDHSGFVRIIHILASAQPPNPRSAEEIAQVLAHAARLLRSVVVAQCELGLDDVVSDVRADFNQTLFARAEAGGYDPTDADALFASAFAQTLVFGLLLAREASGLQVGARAYELLPDATYPLLRGTLRALTLDEVRSMLGAAFDVSLDAVNSVDRHLLTPREGRDPVLYLYEDFLRVFDPDAVRKYGVYYTPPEIVQLIVAETDRSLKQGLGSAGLLDQNVNLLDPACGTGTFLIAAASAVARSATAAYGEGARGAEVSAFAQRVHGFELLVGPYTVAHYRMLREVAAHGGTAAHLPIYLTDTLAPPAGAAGVQPHLAFLSAPMMAEREAADAVKREIPILAIMGNPPYKRLRAGEIARLVGPDMNARWEDLKRPVIEAGLGRALNAFPDLYVAFYRWALWRLFEADGAVGRGVLAFITNRGFLTGSGFGGLRSMLRKRFDHIRIIDLRGDNRGSRPATVPFDENVFNIEVGVCILVAYATGEKEAAEEGEVVYADAWRERAFSRQEKLDLALAAAADENRLQNIPVRGSGMAPLKPPGFSETDWPSIEDIFTVRFNGIVTYRDAFAYHIDQHALAARLRNWLMLPLPLAAAQFGESSMNKVGPALQVAFDESAIHPVSYRPLDIRFLYQRSEYVDRLRPDLQAAWGAQNIALFSMRGVGQGPAVWCHGLKPDQHSFRGSYGGWAFPLRNHAPESLGHFLNPLIIPGLSAIYGEELNPQDLFDAVLGLLSATSYTVRFAHDLEDDFPHVPLPADPSIFASVARLGRRIRELETFAAAPAQPYHIARLSGHGAGRVLDLPTPQRAFIAEAGVGEVALLADRSFRISNVPERVWQFSVSGYPVLYRWLRARNGELISAGLQRSVLDIVARVEELLRLFDEADQLLVESLQAPLTRIQIGLPRRDRAAPYQVEEGDGAA